MSAPPHATHTQGRARAGSDATGASGSRSQALFRNLNEQIFRIAESFAVDEPLELCCECELEDCFARLSCSHEQYEAIRRFPTRFLLRADHVGPDDRIVEEAAGFVVVEKIGAAAETAILLDPRKTGANGRVS